jgi:transketolase
MVGHDASFPDSRIGMTTPDQPPPRNKSRTGLRSSIDSKSPVFRGTVELARKIRLHALRMTNRAGSSHIGSILSCADIVAVLYGHFLRVDPARPRWADRDRFVLSKGHAGAAVYAALAERGFFPIVELESHCRDGGNLGGHVSHKNVPGVEFSTGSLGHGLPVAAGFAYSAKLDRAKHRVVALLSDGECDEGSTWEAALFASHHRLENLIAIIDYNKVQSLGFVSDTLELEPFAKKWESFGWRVIETDGHDHDQLISALGQTSASTGRPSCVIAHTVKGRGVSFMENSVLWHYRIARNTEFDLALEELENHDA